MKHECGGVGNGEQLYCCRRQSNHGTARERKRQSRPQQKWKRRMDAHLTEQGGRELLKCKNREAGDASDGLVSCTVQICAAHTPQTFLETRLLQSDDLGFSPDQVCMCCSFGVVIQVGPTNAACLTSTNPPPVSVKYPRQTLRTVLCCRPIGFRSLDCTMEGFASLA